MTATPTTPGHHQPPDAGTPQEPPPAAVPYRISAAISHIAEASRRQTGGQWLEHLTADIAPAYI